MRENPLIPNPLSEVFLWVFLLALASGGIVFSMLFHFSVLLPLLLCGGILALILLFRAPILLLFGLIIVRMSLDYSSQYFSFTLFNITLSLSQLLGVGIALLGIMVLILKRKTLPSFPLNVPFFIIFLWGIATLLYTLYPKTTLQELLRFFDLFALGFLAYATIETTRDFKHLLQAFFLSSVLPVAFGLYQFIFHIGLLDENVSILRIFGTFSHPNVYSLYLFAMIVFAGLYLLLFAEGGLKRLITLSGLALLSIMLLLTFARVAWIALFIFAFLLALFRYRLLLFPLILFPIILYVFSPLVQERITESFRSDPDSSLVWRTTLWQDVIRYSIQEERLLLGSGMDTFPKVSESVRGTTHGPNDPHNDFLKFFIEGGLVGLGAFIIYLGSIGYLIIKKYKESKRESALRLAYGVMFLFFLTLELSALTDNIFKNTPVQWLFFTALGALLALSAQKNNK
ncbi:MAG: O-antigen ligase family protein [Candidatus Moranbacteria bacterium]|nr:O-antigen ligase family protein [Candidatus Moranbacteria bacterium]